MFDKNDERRSYEDFFGKEASDSTMGFGASPVTSAPAAVNRTQTEVTEETFDTAGDEPKDPDIKQKPPTRLVVDSITAQIGAELYYSDARFEWCKSLSGYKMRFSRRYAQPSVLVDIFNNDSKAVREEVARKRACLEEHNEMVRELLEEKAEEYEKYPEFFLQRGEVIFGYLPLLVDRQPEANFEGAINGEVTDLPPKRQDPNIEAYGVGNRVVY